MAQTVDVRIIFGQYRPCNTCRWYSECIVPKHSHLPKRGFKKPRIVYRCEDYTRKGDPYVPTAEE